MPSLTLPLASDGPVLEILVSLVRSRRYVLNRFKLPVPEPVRVRTLIDTGATFSCFDSSVFAHLGLESIYEVSVLTPGTGGVPQQLRQYEVDLELSALVDQGVKPFERVTVVEASLAAQGIEGLIGRDVLNSCLFVYDGNGNNFSLSFGL